MFTAEAQGKLATRAPATGNGSSSSSEGDWIHLPPPLRPSGYVPRMERATCLHSNPPARFASKCPTTR